MTEILIKRKQTPNKEQTKVGYPKSILMNKDRKEPTTMAEYHIKPGKIGKKVLETYEKIENGVVGTYHKIEDGVVGTYQKVEDAFVEKFLEEKEDHEEK